MHLMTKVTPQQDESIRSYLTRLALDNDYLTVQHLFDEFNDVKHLVINSCEESLFEFTQQVGGIEDTSIFSPLSSGLATISNKGQLGYRTLMDKAPHVCPMCMTTQKYTCSHWQLYPITHCHNHDLKLISRCICGENLRWNEELLNYGCSQCDASWQKIASLQSVSKTPVYVKYFYQITGEQKNDFIEDLFTASMRALRPFDSIHHGIKHLPRYVSNWHELCGLAYRLLTDKDTIQHWCSSMLYTRGHYAVLGDKATFYPIITMQENLHNKWLVSGYTPRINNVTPSVMTLPSNPMTTCSARNEAVRDCLLIEKDDKLINHLDQPGFANMLGCDIDLARRLFKVPSVSTVTKVSRGKFSFIDISDFINQTRDQNTAKHYEVRKLADLKQLVEMYTLTTQEVLAEIYKYKLPIYVDLKANSFIDKICINESVLANCLETTYLNDEIEVTLTRAMRILSIPRNRVLQLGNMEYLEELPSKPSTHSYSGKSIARFLANYVCIERWATMNNACHGKVAKAIKDNAITPVISPFVYAKTDELICILSDYSGHHWQAQEQLSLFK
jgi:hypothetical protein